MQVQASVAIDCPLQPRAQESRTDRNRPSPLRGRKSPHPCNRGAGARPWTPASPPKRGITAIISQLPRSVIPALAGVHRRDPLPGKVPGPWPFATECCDSEDGACGWPAQASRAVSRPRPQVRRRQRLQVLEDWPRGCQHLGTMLRTEPCGQYHQADPVAFVCRSKFPPWRERGHPRQRLPLNRPDGSTARRDRPPA
jgi:hypothetical protein